MAWTRKRLSQLRPTEDLPAELSLLNRILAMLRSDPLVNSVVLLAITVGFFHGWLKFNYPHPVTTFLFDATLLAALGLVFLQHKGRDPFIPRGPIRSALIAFYVICVVYALMPMGPPLLVSIAALRGWCFATLMYALGFNLTRSLGQVKAYFYILIILGVITGVYGIRQSTEEIERRMSQDEQMSKRLLGTYYATQSGKVELRRFSTFVTAGAFGGVMAYVTIFALALVSDEGVKRGERVLLAAAILPVAYAMILTGSRSALVMAGFGFLVLAWYRRKAMTFVVLPLAFYLALKWGAAFTKGASVERFGTLLDSETVWARTFMPFLSAWTSFQQAPLGTGLGDSGYSVPFVLVGKTGYTGFRGAEGDLCALTVEMGILGVLFFVRILWVTLQMVFTSLKQLRGSPVATVALASAACVVLAVVAFPIGSPFLGIPTGALTWFFIGTLHKLAEAHQTEGFGAAPVQPALPPPANRFLYYRPERKSARPSAGGRSR